ncbi:MAG: molybdenum ABC transporter molybdate-binding protein [Rickettsiales bacterium]|jgi:molybdenum ABC transporter molybdate-binding protein
MQENLQKISDIKFDEKGLVPAIAQDYKTGEVLMFAWMNKASLEETIKTKFAHYFSRSRQNLWKKGETSGNTQRVHEILIDCDNDCLIIKIDQKGVACHTGTRTCFYRNLMAIATMLLINLLATFPSNSYAQKTSPVDNLTILAESNMTYPLVSIARLYSEKENAIVSINFNYSSQLIRHIDDGEPADIFISSHQSWVEMLKRKGLVDVYNLANIAKDKLLLVSVKNNKKLDFSKISDLSDLNQMLEEINRLRVPLIIDSSSTSLGNYSNKILDEAKVDQKNVYRRIDEDSDSLIESINKSQDYAGIVLASSIKNYSNIVVLKEIDNSEIYYQALVIAGDNMGKARDFLKFIKTKEMAEIFIDNGFIVD